MNKYKIIGLMSGTSMDGLDLVYCSFNMSHDGSWNYILHSSDTFSYPKNLLDKLHTSTSLSAQDLILLDKELGKFFGNQVLHFLTRSGISATDVDGIASHGHTIFHQPELGFTHQIGCGSTIAKITGIDVINDFRTKDVVYGGQGAPLVPIGDKLLFSKEADAFLNIGGFSNICIPGDTTIAFDICPGNLPLNNICKKFHKEEFDRDGRRAKSGKILPDILTALNQLKFYNQSAPKSLGTEWLEEVFNPSVPLEAPSHDILRTITEHIAVQISNIIDHYPIQTLYITGGGVKNRF
ncbi:MAG: anhydro-N-acetylmuramic acid kinase, partial [Crocinitomicaceae bacterium]|nr:anhydro-N-acetylmuramic acid kinase [Crocinitomicaceae bacterium]